MPEKKRGRIPCCQPLVAILFLLNTWACGGGRAPVQPEPPPQPVIKKVVVLGFEALVRPGQKPNLARNHITGTAFMSHPVPEKEVDWLTDQLFSRLVDDKRWTLIPPGQARGVVESLLESPAGSEPDPREIVQEVGKAFGADAVLIGQVYRWRERIGSDFGVESPASVAFDLSLVRPADGAIIWRGNYDKTQKSLMEDLFDFKTYMKSDGLWLTARRLALLGLDRMLEEMPGKRAAKGQQDRDGRTRIIPATPKHENTATVYLLNGSGRVFTAKI